jgi:hypothetical protein
MIDYYDFKFNKKIKIGKSEVELSFMKRIGKPILGF